MDNRHWQIIDALLDEYLDASEEARATFLDEKKPEPEIRAELERLIAAIAKSSDLYEDTGFTPVSTLLDAGTENHLIGTRIDSYQLVKLLGTGGMGSVYLAKRVDDFNIEVALKLIPKFSNSRGSSENFRRERQILARLNHPNIARILDGGTTVDGTPFLVMEYVDGVPLNEFCRDQNVSAKLDLFQDVCEAVSFAHKNLIIHRDLKPTNIFVTADTTVKLLDFGIAKLQEADETPTPTLGGIALTPEYASPEQLNGDNINVTSDVYSLGVVLYEVLTGKRPHYLKGKTLAEAARIVATEEPKEPGISRELDAVVLKALAKSPRDRYQTAEELRSDISNYLRQLPVTARPNTYLYRFEKYIRRQKIGVAVAVAITLLALGWIATVVSQSFRASAQAKENRRIAYAAEMILAANEYENTNLNRVNELIEKYRPVEGDSDDLRGFEWFFTERLINPTSRIATLVHPDEVWSTEFSPDGELLATVSNDNITRLWNVRTGSLASQFAPQKGAWKCSFFPDGKRIAVAGSSNSAPVVSIYRVDSGAEILTLRGHQKRVRAIDISPSGQIAATGSLDGTVRIWNAENGELIRSIDFSKSGRADEISDVQFSPDGNELLALSFQSVSIIDTKSGRVRSADKRQFEEKNLTFVPWKASYSPLGKTIAIGCFSGEVLLVDAKTLKLVKILPLHQSNVKSLAFTKDGSTLVTGSWDRTVKFVNVKSGDVLYELKGHFAGVHDVAFSPDGTLLATASADFKVHVWNASKVAESGLSLSQGSITKFTEDASGVVAWENVAGQISYWSIAQKRAVWARPAKIYPFSTDISSKSGRIAFAERDGFLSVFNLTDGSAAFRIQIYPKSAYAVKFSVDGKRVFMIFEDGVFAAVDAIKGETLRTMKLHADIAKCLAVTPDGRFIATAGNDRSVKVLNAETFETVYEFTKAVRPVFMVEFSPDGSLLAAAGADDTVRIWRMSDGQQVNELTGMSAGVFAVAFSPDGKRIATASDIGIIRLWETQTGRQVLAFTVGKKQIISLRFSNDGRTLFTGDTDGNIRPLESR